MRTRPRRWRYTPRKSSHPCHSSSYMRSGREGMYGPSQGIDLPSATHSSHSSLLPKPMACQPDGADE
eukprot:1921541-Pleurochrysis_carterae.AAC.6